MKIINVEQGTPEWLRARIGVLTASNFDKLITPKKMEPSKSIEPLVFRTLAEEVLQRPLDDASSGFMARGSEMEGAARHWYEWENDVEIERVGFCVRDDGKVGYSPDGFVGADGLVEFKVPAAHVHMGYLLGVVPDEYYCQLQGGLYVTGRAWIDWVSYHPDIEPVCLRYQRDEKFIAKLVECIDVALGMLETHRVTLRAKGLLPEIAAESRRAA